MITKNIIYFIVMINVNIKITNDFNIELHYTYILPSLINQAIQRNLKKPWKKEDKILIFPYVRKY